MRSTAASWASWKDELGDLLLRVVFHARMAEEAGAFAFGDVVPTICDKMVRRHPHVFDASGRPLDPAARRWRWMPSNRPARGGVEAHRTRGWGDADASTLAGISAGCQEWQRAVKLQHTRRPGRLRLAGA